MDILGSQSKVAKIRSAEIDKMLNDPDPTELRRTVFAKDNLHKIGLS